MLAFFVLNSIFIQKQGAMAIAAAGFFICGWRTWATYIKGKKRSIIWFFFCIAFALGILGGFAMNMP